MPNGELELDGFSIVVLGSFNPTIFQPSWFSDNELIRKEEATAAKIEIIHRNASIFTTEWFSLQVLEGRFTVETKDPTKSLPLRDLAFGTFKILEHTPISAFGLNRYQHYRMESEDSWHAFGHYFAPKEPWNAIIVKPGLRIMIMEGKRESCPARIQVRIEPSDRVASGLIISVNEHHNLLENETATNADRNRLFLTSLKGQWDEFLNYAQEASKHLLSEPSDQTTPSKRKRRR